MAFKLNLDIRREKILQICLKTGLGHRTQFASHFEPLDFHSCNQTNRHSVYMLNTLPRRIVILFIIVIFAIHRALRMVNERR